MDPQVLAYLPLVSLVATLIVVIVGVLFSNRHVDIRVSDLRAYMDARFSDMEKLNETLMTLLLGKVEDIDNRLARLEERFAR